ISHALKTRQHAQWPSTSFLTIKLDGVSSFTHLSSAPITTTFTTYLFPFHQGHFDHSISYLPPIVYRPSIHLLHWHSLALAHHLPLQFHFHFRESTMSVEVARLCKTSLLSANVGTGENEVQNGRDFYKFFFTNYPTLRVYFKGAENFTADDVQKSDRFEKQGQRILLATHILAETFANQDVFKAYVRETINRHRIYKMDPALWLAFFTVFTGYLETKTKLDDATKKAWAELGKVFNEEAQTHLKNSGLPHA
ncbi:hypothetical protein PENTCL1PPCAC_17118, partial [Pristionchus entomophagus]